GQFDRAVADLEDMIQARGGRVTIASLISVATHVLPRVLGRFSAAHPDVSVRVLDDAEREIAEYVRQGDAEFAVDMLTAETDPDLAASVLMEDPFVLACPAGHPLAAGGPLRLEALFGQPIVTLGARTGTSRLLLDRLEATGRPLPWRYEVQHLSTLIGFVEAGVAVGLAPRLAMRPLAGRRLAHRPLDEPGLNRTVALIERRGATLSPIAARLKGMILEEARDWPPAG
ncbi:MAG: LysR substrate-binding domain-containing protein, partial [Alphaproteobacteria bacterium]